MYAEYIENLIGCLNRTILYDKNGNSYKDYEAAIRQLVSVFTDAKKAGKQVFFIGNGGSAAIASHMTADFMKNHAAALTLASYVPMLGEEALASVRGVRQASKVASKDVVKGLTKNYAKAWGTYALVAGLVSGAVALGIAISDKIKQKKSA